MTNYTKTTDFAAKDALPSGNSAKIVKGSEIDTEFNNIATASATKANANDAALTGTTTFETISDGTIAITAFVDEDNMASDSATLVPTQQSVKAYVDSQVTAQDLDFQADSGGALSIDLDSETLTFTGGTGVDTSGSGNAVTFAIDSTVATLTGSQTLSNKTLATPVVSGNLTTDGLIDGRDVATDGTKLDGIESGATADQTAAEIKTAYESNANTNAFTDADESKLDGIEALADVTDTTNVTAAGALMDSELTNITAVKALNQGVATTDSPTFAGLTTTADVSFGDNDKATFGASSDLQIYHNGSRSVITDQGTGPLRISATNLEFKNADDTKLYANATDGGAFNLYYDNAQVFSTTSSGIDTGTVTADGLTLGSEGDQISIPTSAGFSGIITTGDSISGNAFEFKNGNGIAIVSDTNDSAVTGGVDATLIARGSSATKTALFDANGDVSLFEDTGTTAKFYWDSSAESLGIGTSSPAAAFHVDNGAGTRLFVGLANNIYYDGYDHIFRTPSGASTSMTVANSGRVGIGISSPAQDLHIREDSGDCNLLIDSANGASQIFFGDDESVNAGKIGYNHASNFMAFHANATEAMRIDSSGNLLVNTTNQSGRVTVDNGANNTGIYVLQSSSTVNQTGISVKSDYVTGGQTGTMVRFIQTSDATVGTISSTITATAYNTSSDQRLKDNIVHAPSASDDIDAIQVRSFDWKADGSHQKYGMVAQELQSVAPEAVTGDADSDEMMGVDYSKLVPMLVKEIQSLRARVQQLENN
ncbi:MAG: tail fiber domain-containing protein [Rhodospirillales bacterium]